MTDEVSAFVCPGVIAPGLPVLQVLLPILWGLLLAMLGSIIALFRPSTLKNLAKLLWRQKLAVCLLAVAIGGVVYGLNTLVFANRVPTSDAETGKDWTTARGGLLRTGAVPGTGTPNVKKLIWTFTSGSEAFFSSPAVVGNRIYLASVGAFQKSGAIWCLDADTGGLVWSCAPDNYRPTFSSPVVSGKYLVCGEGLHDTRDARVVCLDIGDPKTAKVAWTFTTNNHVECTPVIADGRVYFGAGDDGIYCLDLEPGPGGKAQVHWHVPNSHYFGPDKKQLKDGLNDERFVIGAWVVFRSEVKDGKTIPVRIRPLSSDEDVNQAKSDGEELSSGKIKTLDVAAKVMTVTTADGSDLVLTMSEYSDAETAIAVQGDRVYMGLGNEGKALCVIDAKTGNRLHRLSVDYPVFSPPTIADGKLYVGMGEGDYIHDGDKGAVVCIDLKTFTRDWIYPGEGKSLPKTVLGAVAIKGDRLFFGCDDGFLYCLSRTGSLINKFDARSPIKTSPAVTDQGVYIVSDSGRLFALKEKTLQTMWDYPLGSQGSFFSSPVAAQGHIYVGTERYGVLCVGSVGEEKPAPPLWPNPLGGSGRAGNDDQSPFPKGDPAPHWTFPAADAKKGDKTSATASIACWKDDLFVPYTITRGKRPADGAVACIPRQAESQPKPRWVHEVVGATPGPPVVLMDCVAAKFSRPVGSAAELHCMDRDSGSLLWDREISDSSLVTASTRHILVSEKKEFLTCLGLDGKEVWSTAVGMLTQCPASTDSMIVVATTRDLLALDEQSGQLLWRIPFSGALTSPVVAGNVIYVGTNVGLEARSLVDGQPLPNWHSQGGAVSADFALRNKDIFYVNRSSELVVVDCDTGNVKMRLKGPATPTPGYTPLVSRGQVVVVADKGKGLAIANLEAKPDPEKKKQPTVDLWFNLEMASLSDQARMVLSDAHIFLPTKDNGLLSIGREK